MSGLATANRITVWLENQHGHDEYIAKFGKESYFLHFKAGYATDGTLLKLNNALNYLEERIKSGTPKLAEFPFALTKKVKGGTAGAVYLYAEPEVQEDIAAVRAAIVSTCTQWATDNGVPMSPPQYAPNDELYVSFYLSLP